MRSSTTRKWRDFLLVRRHSPLSGFMPTGSASHRDPALHIPIRSTIMPITANALVLSLTLVGLAANAHAAPIFSTGAGAAVTTVHRSATFDALDAIGIDLSAYHEDGL